MRKSPQSVALRCSNVDKLYPIQKETRIWRLLFGAKSQGRFIHALHDVSMEVPRGKLIGILGKNGAGKSTLLRVLGGVYTPTRGRIDAYGQIAGLFELGGMGNTNLTGRDYSTRYLLFMGVRRKDLTTYLEDIQDFSELGDAFDQRVRTYSSGMGARLYFATATALQNEIYLIDEILSVGDEHFQAKCWRRMRQRLSSGASGVLVTHDWSAVLKLCEQAHVIDRGKISFSGASDKAVVSYLNIPVPKATCAQFSVRNPQKHIVNSKQDTNLQLWVDIQDTTPVDLAVSIEMLRIGVGWEVVILANRIPIADKPGQYMVNVFIPQLPLGPGTYSLNAFLCSPRANPQDATVIFDVRSWTIGNGYQLLVMGKESTASVNLPVIARKLGSAV